MPLKFVGDSFVLPRGMRVSFRIVFQNCMAGLRHRTITFVAQTELPFLRWDSAVLPRWLPWVPFVRVCGPHPIGSNNRLPRTNDCLCIVFRILAPREILVRSTTIDRDKRFPLRRRRRFLLQHESRQRGSKRIRPFPVADTTFEETP